MQSLHRVRDRWLSRQSAEPSSPRFDDRLMGANEWTVSKDEATGSRFLDVVIVRPATLIFPGPGVGWRWNVRATDDTRANAIGKERQKVTAVTTL